MGVDANKALVRRLIERLNAGDPAVDDELIAADFVHNGRAVSRAAIKAGHARTRAAFPDLRITIEDLVGERDTVAIRAVYEGTHRGEARIEGLGTVPPTGRRFRYAAMSFLRVADGRVAEEWGVRDRLGLAQQLGVLAAPTEG